MLEHKDNEWVQPTWGMGTRRKYKPDDVEWLREHINLMPKKHLVEWFNHERGFNYTERSLRNVLEENGIKNTNKKVKLLPNVLCLKKILKGQK